jgi:O-antigen/teichoic acid export membrane protein
VDTSEATVQRVGARRAVGVGASIAALATLASAFFGGLTTLVVARILGASGTGAYSVILATLAGLIVLAALGLDTSALYHVAGRRWSEAHAVRHLQLAAAVLGAIGIGIGVAAGVLFRDSLFHGIGLGTLTLGLVALPFALSWNFGSAVSFANDAYEWGSVPWVIQGVVGLALVAALTRPYGLTGAVAGITLSHAIVAGLVAVRGIHRTRGEVDRWLAGTFSALRMAVGFGYKANLTKVMAIVNQRADLLILNAYAAHAAVGQYGVALSLTALQVLVPSSLSRAVVPRVSSLGSASSPYERDELIRKSVRHGILISILTGAAMAVALLAVPIVFGSDFEPSVQLGWILIPGTTAYGMAYGFSSVIVGRGHPGYILRATAIVTPLTVLLYFLLIPKFGATGAAVASTLSYTGTFVLYWLYFRRVSGISKLRALLPGRAEIEDYRLLLGRLQARPPTP